MKTDAEILPGYPIEAYLEREDGADWNADTRTSYRRVLYELQKYLGGKPPDAGALSRWQRDLRENGYHQHSINIRISAANNYFRWCGRYDLLMHHGPADSMPAPELTRTEYLRMLRTARRRGWHQIYLLVKLFVITGLPLQCLDQVTPQVVEAGGATLSCRSSRYILRLPKFLRQELLEYIQEKQLVSGPVFATRNGRPINRLNLCRKMQERCREAGVPEEKGNPRCLRNLCRATQDNLYANLEQQLLQVYDMLLQAEQESTGWVAGA